MSTTMKIDPQDPRLTGYVLGALTPAALQRFEQELDRCPPSRAYAEELSAAAALLGEALAAEPLTLLSAAQRSAVATELSGQAAPAAREVEAGPQASELEPPRRGWTRGRSGRAPGMAIFSVVMVAAAVLLMVGALVFVAVRGDQERSAEQKDRLVNDRPRLRPSTPLSPRVGGTLPPPPPDPGPRPTAPASQRVGGSLPPKLRPTPAREETVERLTAEQIQTVMRTAGPAVKRCSAKYDGEGLLKVRITVQPSGEVAAQVLGSFAGKPMGFCILGAMYTLRFPRFSGAAVTFVYPYRLVAGPAPKPLSKPAPGELKTFARAKQLLLRAQNAYVSGDHRRAVQLCKQVLKLIPDHYKAVQILGASSCYLREARDAQWAYDRVAVSYRPLLKKVCFNNGIELRD